MGYMAGIIGLALIATGGMMILSVSSVAISAVTIGSIVTALFGCISVFSGISLVVLYFIAGE
jgi:hypothetical protein